MNDNGTPASKVDPNGLGSACAINLVDVVWWSHAFRDLVMGGSVLVENLE